MSTISNFILLVIATFFVGSILIILLKKFDVSKKIIKESIFVLSLMIFGEIIAGVILSDISKFLEVAPGVIVLIPIVSGTRGSIMGIFCSRLTSALHLGYIKPTAKNFFSRKSILTQNILGILVLSIFIAFLSGAVAHFTSIIFGYQSAGLLKFAFIVLIASFLSDITLILTGVLTSFISYRKGLDPDNLLFPINTTISDAISSLFLVLAVRMVI